MILRTSVESPARASPAPSLIASVRTRQSVIQPWSAVAAPIVGPDRQIHVTGASWIATAQAASTVIDTQGPVGP